MGEWGYCNKDTVGAVLDASVSRHPDKAFFVLDGQAVTYAKMDERATSWANALLERGVGPGDRVATYMANCPETVYSWLATAKVGAIHVPINTALRGEFLAHQLATADPSIIVSDAALVPQITAVSERLGGLRHLVVRGEASEPWQVPAGARWSVHSSEAMLSGGHSSLRAVRAPRFDDLNAIFFTSGTTGRSKGVAASHNYAVALARRLTANFNFTAESVWYQPSPLFHINAALTVVLGPLLVGATGCSDSRFSASSYWDTVRRYKATHISFLTFGVILWKQPERPDDADNPVRYASGTAIPPDLHEPLERRFNLRIIKSYGLSEACATPLMSTYDAPSPPGYSGRPNPDFDVALFDENDEKVPPGTPGEIVVRPKAPYMMFSGYYNDPAATAEVWRNGWFHTGDIGRVGEDGWYAFVDRRKDYIRRRGENISSFELEGVLVGHHGIAEVAVHAVPSELGEDDVKACLVLDPAVTVREAFDIDEFMSYCEAKLPYFAIPRYVEVLGALPRNQTGRVLKAELRSRGVTDATYDRGK